MIKRSFDLLLAALGLAFLWPVMLATALCIGCTMGRPVIFSQQRPGMHAKPFTMYKFRSMRDATDAEGRPLPDGARLTRLGTLLRATSLDELPELWNVLRGDMSLVGPRPLLMAYLPRYSATQARRHEVRPGITGWAQVNGRNALTWDEKFALDVWYVDNRSLWLDLKILCRTIAAVLTRRGISKKGHATMPPFEGEEGSAK